MLLRSLIAPAQQKALQHFVLPKINMNTKSTSFEPHQILILLLTSIFVRLSAVTLPRQFVLALPILGNIMTAINKESGMSVGIEFKGGISFALWAATSPYWVPAMLRHHKILDPTEIQGWRWELVYWTVTATWIMYAMDTELGYQLVVSYYSNSFYQRFFLTVLITKIAQFKDPFGWILLDILAVSFAFHVKWTERQDSGRIYGLTAIFYLFLVFVYETVLKVFVKSLLY